MAPASRPERPPSSSRNILLMSHILFGCLCSTSSGQLGPKCWLFFCLSPVIPHPNTPRPSLGCLLPACCLPVACPSCPHAGHWEVPSSPPWPSIFLLPSPASRWKSFAT